LTGDVDVNTASADELGDYMAENRLNVQQVKDMVPDDADLEMLEKFWDAETHASNNEPRRGVTDYLDARIAALGKSQ
jgi:hypothetical protein